MNLGKAIKVSLALKQMTQAELANEMGITPQAVTRWVKTNSMPLNTLDKVATFFKISPSEFLARGEG